MKITIEITSAEAAQLIDHLHLQDAPCILSEIHEDFEEAIPAQPKPEKKPKAKKGKGGRPKSRPVYVKDGEGWKSFPTPKDAAEHIGCERQKVYDSLSKGFKCQGREITYNPPEEEEILPR